MEYNIYVSVYAKGGMPYQILYLVASRSLTFTKLEPSLVKHFTLGPMYNVTVSNIVHDYDFCI